MKTSRLLALALGLGILVTGLTGLINNTPEGLVGAVHYGYPLPWLYQVVYPGAPMQVDPVILLVDIAIWSVIIGMILLLLQSVSRA
jgi:hypothetical protein